MAVLQNSRDRLNIIGRRSGSIEQKYWRNSVRRRWSAGRQNQQRNARDELDVSVFHDTRATTRARERVNAAAAPSAESQPDRAPKYSGGLLARRTKRETNPGPAATACFPIISKAFSARARLTAAGVNLTSRNDCFRGSSTARNISAESDASNIGTSRVAALAPILRKAVTVGTFVAAAGLSRSSSHWLSERPCSLGSRPRHIGSARMPSALRSSPAIQTTFRRRGNIMVWSNVPAHGQPPGPAQTNKTQTPPSPRATDEARGWRLWRAVIC